MVYGFIKMKLIWICYNIQQILIVGHWQLAPFGFGGNGNNGNNGNNNNGNGSNPFGNASGFGSWNGLNELNGWNDNGNNDYYNKMFKMHLFLVMK